MSFGGSLLSLGTNTSRSAMLREWEAKNVLEITRRGNQVALLMINYSCFPSLISTNPGYVLAIDFVYILHNGEHYSSPTRCYHLAENVTQSSQGHSTIHWGQMMTNMEPEFHEHWSTASIHLIGSSLVRRMHYGTPWPWNSLSPWMLVLVALWTGQAGLYTNLSVYSSENNVVSLPI